MPSPTAPLLGPLFALAGWTLVMEAWMYTYRLPDLGRYKVDTNPKMTVADMNKNIPRHRQWPADNYNHLHEQPTVFYAVALGLTFLDASDSTTVRLAWAYVGARIIHSLVQATSNIIPLRFGIFALSSTLLAGLAVKGLLLATA